MISVSVRLDHHSPSSITRSATCPARSSPPSISTGSPCTHFVNDSGLNQLSKQFLSYICTSHNLNRNGRKGSGFHLVTTVKLLWCPSGFGLRWSVNLSIGGGGRGRLRKSFHSSNSPESLWSLTISTDPFVHLRCFSVFWFGEERSAH